MSMFSGSGNRWKGSWNPLVYKWYSRYILPIGSFSPLPGSKEHNPLVIHQKKTNSCKLFKWTQKKRTLQIIIFQVPSLTPENLKSWNTSQTFYKRTDHGLWGPLPQPATTRNHPIKEKCSILTQRSFLREWSYQNYQINPKWFRIPNPKKRTFYQIPQKPSK